MRLSAALPSGVTALFFEAARERRELESRWVARLEAAGFSEALLPILDFADPYDTLLPTRGRGEVYRFIDRGGELLVLRADFTPMLARLLAPMLGASQLPPMLGALQSPPMLGASQPPQPPPMPGGLDLPLRLFYRGDVVRYAEERPGRMREFYQLGAEWIGPPGAAGQAGEREMLTRFLDLLAVSDGDEARVVLGFAGALDELLLGCGQDPAALAAAVARRERGVARAAHPALAEVVERGVPASSAALGSVADELDAILALARTLRSEFPRLAIDVDLADFAEQVTDPGLGALMPGAAYYDGLMYRAYVGGSTLPAGSGGRYDGLFRRLGADVSAAGFSLGLDRPRGPERAPARDAEGERR